MMNARTAEVARVVTRAVENDGEDGGEEAEKQQHQQHSFSTSQPGRQAAEEGSNDQQQQRQLTDSEMMSRTEDILTGSTIDALEEESKGRTSTPSQQQEHETSAGNSIKNKPIGANKEDNSNNSNNNNNTAAAAVPPPSSSSLLDRALIIESLSGANTEPLHMELMEAESNLIPICQLLAEEYAVSSLGGSRLGDDDNHLRRRGTAEEEDAEEAAAQQLLNSAMEQLRYVMRYNPDLDRLRRLKVERLDDDGLTHDGRERKNEFVETVMSCVRDYVIDMAERIALETKPKDSFAVTKLRGALKMKEGMVNMYARAGETKAKKLDSVREQLVCMQTVFAGLTPGQVTKLFKRVEALEEENEYLYQRAFAVDAQLGRDATQRTVHKASLHSHYDDENSGGGGGLKRHVSTMFGAGKRKLEKHCERLECEIMAAHDVESPQELAARLKREKEEEREKKRIAAVDDLMHDSSDDDALFDIQAPALPPSPKDDASPEERKAYRDFLMLVKLERRTKRRAYIAKASKNVSGTLSTAAIEHFGASVDSVANLLETAATHRLLARELSPLALQVLRKLAEDAKTEIEATKRQHLAVVEETLHGHRQQLARWVKVLEKDQQPPTHHQQAKGSRRASGVHSNTTQAAAEAAQDSEDASVDFAEMVDRAKKRGGGGATPATSNQSAPAAGGVPKLLEPFILDEEEHDDDNDNAATTSASDSDSLHSSDSGDAKRKKNRSKGIKGKKGKAALTKTKKTKTEGQRQKKKTTTKGMVASRSPSPFQRDIDESLLNAFRDNNKKQKAVAKTKGGKKKKKEKSPAATPHPENLTQQEQDEEDNQQQQQQDASGAMAGEMSRLIELQNEALKIQAQCEKSKRKKTATGKGATGSAAAGAAAAGTTTTATVKCLSCPHCTRPLRCYECRSFIDINVDRGEAEQGEDVEQLVRAALNAGMASQQLRHERMKANVGLTAAELLRQKALSDQVRNHNNDSNLSPFRAGTAPDGGPQHNARLLSVASLKHRRGNRTPTATTKTKFDPAIDAMFERAQKMKQVWEKRKQELASQNKALAKIFYQQLVFAMYRGSHNIRIREPKLQELLRHAAAVVKEQQAQESSPAREEDHDEHENENENGGGGVLDDDEQSGIVAIDDRAGSVEFPRRRRLLSDHRDGYLDDDDDGGDGGDDDDDDEDLSGADLAGGLPPGFANDNSDDYGDGATPGGAQDIAAAQRSTTATKATKTTAQTLNAIVAPRVLTAPLSHRPTTTHQTSRWATEMMSQQQHQQPPSSPHAHEERSGEEEEGGKKNPITVPLSDQFNVDVVGSSSRSQLGDRISYRPMTQQLHQRYRGAVAAATNNRTTAAATSKDNLSQDQPQRLSSPFSSPVIVSSAPLAELRKPMASYGGSSGSSGGNNSRTLQTISQSLKPMSPSVSISNVDQLQQPPVAATSSNLTTALWNKMKTAKNGPDVEPKNTTTVQTTAATASTVLRNIQMLRAEEKKRRDAEAQNKLAKQQQIDDRQQQQPQQLQSVSQQQQQQQLRSKTPSMGLRTREGFANAMEHWLGSTTTTSATGTGNGGSRHAFHRLKNK